MLMLATFTVLNSTVASRAAVVLPGFRGCGRQERGADAANQCRPLCGELAGRCLALGGPFAPMLKAARDARKSVVAG